MPELGNDRYVFTDLDEVSFIITELESMRQDLVTESRWLREAIGLITPPAEDRMSRSQVEAYRESLWKAYTHSVMMHRYAGEQTAKLSAARSAYTEADTSATSRVNRVDR